MMPLRCRSIGALTLLLFPGLWVGPARADGPEVLVTWGSTGRGPGQFNAPGHIYVYVADLGNNRIQAFASRVPVVPVTWSRIKVLVEGEAHRSTRRP
jgi:hypothetical protein